MRRGLFAAFLLPALLASFPHPSIAMANEIELHWNELSGIALGRNVDLRLTDGTRVQGELLVVRPEALSIDVNKTSNKLTYPKGQREIPRASMSTLELRRIKTARWRVVGTTAGVVGGLFAGAGVAVGLCRYTCGRVGRYRRRSRRRCRRKPVGARGRHADDNRENHSVRRAIQRSKNIMTASQAIESLFSTVRIITP